MTSLAHALVACHECGRVHQERELLPGDHAECRRCGGHLYRQPAHDGLQRSLALFLSALGLFLIANLAPFITLEFGGLEQPTRLLSAGLALHAEGMPELALLVLLTSILFPLATMLSMIYLLLPAVAGRQAPAMGPVFRITQLLLPWSLLGVFLLGTLVALVKLLDLASVVPGIGLFAFVGAMLAFSGARASFDPRALWALSPVPQLRAHQYQDNVELLHCHGCGLLRPRGDGLERCPRCLARLHARKQYSIERTWALVITAIVLFIPANIFPMMTVVQMGEGEPDTILSGVVKLIDSGFWGLGLLVFFVSLVVPIAKLASLIWLLQSVQRRSLLRPRDRTRLYRVTEVVGSWSMVDVYLVGLLSGLVNMGVLASVTPGIGILFFASVVVITMFAAASFDPRLIWDQLPGTANPAGGEPATEHEQASPRLRTQRPDGPVQA